MTRTQDRATLRGWLDRDAAGRAVLLERALEAARSTTASHHAWIVVDRGCADETPADGPLSGVGFAVKDNIDVAGLATTAGSPVLPSGPVGADAGVVAALRAAGAVVVGETNLHELAMGITSDNATHGAVLNPVDRTRSAGGSSGGSAVAVALGAVPFALATDTGGSVTIPAAWCGVVGYRPTTGRWPGDGVVNISTSRDTVGLHARTVADVQAVDTVVTHQAHRGGAAPSLAGVRLGAPRSRSADVDPEVARVTGEALEALREAGATVVEVDVPGDVEVAGDEGIALFLHEAGPLLRARLAAQGSPDALAPLADLASRVASPDVRALVGAMASQAVGPRAYAAARAARWRLQRDLAGAFASSRLDAMVWPTTPVPPLLAGQGATVGLNGREVPVFATVVRNTGPGSVAGLPAVALPAGTSAQGLPLGLCVEGRAHDDVRLLRLAGAVEDVLADRG